MKDAFTAWLESQGLDTLTSDNQLFLREAWLQGECYGRKETLRTLVGEMDKLAKEDGE